MNKRNQHNTDAVSRFENQTYTGPIQPGVGFPGRDSKGGGVIRRLNPNNYVRVEGKIVYRELLDDTATFSQVAEVFDKHRKYLGIATSIGNDEWLDEDSNLVLGVQYYAPC